MPWNVHESAELLERLRAMNKLSLFVNICCLLVGFQVAAQTDSFLSVTAIANIESQSKDKSVTVMDFLYRNESNVKELSPVLSVCSVPTGVHFSVGTFRSFTSFAASQW